MPTLFGRVRGLARSRNIDKRKQIELPEQTTHGVSKYSRVCKIIHSSFVFVAVVVADAHLSWRERNLAPFRKAAIPSPSIETVSLNNTSVDLKQVRLLHIAPKPEGGQICVGRRMLQLERPW